MPCRNFRRRPVAGATAIGLLVLFSVTGPSKTDERCLPQEVTSEIDGRPLTREEEVAILDQAFHESLARFEDCQTPVSAPGGEAGLSGNLFPRIEGRDQGRMMRGGSGDAARGQTPDYDSSGSGLFAGSGFFADGRGHILTNHHVVSGCNRLEVVFEGSTAAAGVRAVDEANDLALLSTGIESDGAAFRTRPGKLGEEATVAGFPLSGLLSGLNVTGGQVSAVAEPGLLQITVPIQPGNSGSPLLDASARVIGVVTSKLNELKMAELTGSITQNVNFAVKGAIVRGFLDIHGIDYEISAKSAPLSGESVAERARRFTVPVHCWR